MAVRSLFRPAATILAVVLSSGSIRAAQAHPWRTSSS